MALRFLPGEKEPRRPVNWLARWAENGDNIAPEAL